MLEKSNILCWIEQIRVKHWVKNVFVLSPLIFSGNFFETQPLIRCLYAFLIFCVLSSSIYILNDLVDLEHDKRHPKKRFRPIASGRISQISAIWVAIFLSMLGLGLSLMTNLAFIVISSIYIVNNIAYSLVLKNKVAADVISISIGFMLRFLGGVYIIDVEYTRWFLICSFSLSLLLGLGKRRTELETLGDQAIHYRFVLQIYTKEKVNVAMSCACAMSIITYMLFATDVETLERHQTNMFVYTIPIVVYCLLRFMFKVQEGQGTGPVEILFKDKAFIFAGICWIIMSFFIIYIY